MMSFVPFVANPQTGLLLFCAGVQQRLTLCCGEDFGNFGHRCLFEIGDLCRVGTALSFTLQLDALLRVFGVEALNLRLLLGSERCARFLHRDLQRPKSASLLDLTVQIFLEGRLLIRLQSSSDFDHEVIVNLPHLLSGWAIR